MAPSTDYLKLHFIVFLWGFSAILGKLITIPAVEMVAYRALLAAIGMAAVIHFTRGTFRVSRPDLMRLLGIGIVVALHWIAFFESARMANVSVSLVGFATNSLWAAFLEPWLNRKPVKKYEVILGLVVLAGLYIIFSSDFRYRAGFLVAIFAGFSSALFSVLNARMVQRTSARAITFYEMISVFVVTGLFLPFLAATGLDLLFPQLPVAMDVLYIALLAGVCSVYAYTVAVDLMKRMSVFTLQLTLNLEPVYGIIMAVIIFGEAEKMTPNFYIGTIVILSAVLTYPALKKRFERAPFIR